jgi:uncharacterized protein (TIGR03663 family)
LGLFALALGVGGWYRFAALDLRPFHGDEANQAVKTGILLERGEYRYDPHEHHGPTLYYAALPVLRLAGVETLAASTEAQFRVVPAVFGMATLFLTLGLAWAWGRGAALWAAAFMAVSHGLVYYQRYYIQEGLLVFFCAAAIVAAGWWWRRPGAGAALACGAALGLAHATKETCVIAFAAMAGGLALALAWGRLRDGAFTVPGGRPRWAHAALLAGGAVLASVLFYSAFFTHARGPLDSVLAFTTYLTRAEGEGSTAIHDKPWHYYLATLFHVHREAGPRWSEAPILVLAALGAVATLARRRATDDEHAGGLLLRRFMVFYTLLLIAAFSLIPYKTPWNLLIFLHTLTLLAGLGAATLVAWFRPWPLRALCAGLVLAGLGFQARQSHAGNFQYPADTRNPYVYAHTSTALARLERRIDALAAVHPQGRAMQINVLKPDADYWPLPWSLRAFTRVGYWTNPPEQPDAPVIIAAPEGAAWLEARLRGDYFQEYHALRPGVLLQVWIQRGLWDAFLETRR